MEVYFGMETFFGYSTFARYSHFSVGPAVDEYRLSIGGYDIFSGAGDSMQFHHGLKFST